MGPQGLLVFEVLLVLLALDLVELSELELDLESLEDFVVLEGAVSLLAAAL